MVSVIFMLRRVRTVLRHALRQENFGALLAALVVLLAAGTVSFALGEHWRAIDGLYFAWGVLTTTGVADPDLVVHSTWVKLFTILYQLIGIGLVVETLRRLGLSFVATREERRSTRRA